jgi:DNA-binding LacI/PurR family transcriptional regulator
MLGFRPAEELTPVRGVSRRGPTLAAVARAAKVSLATASYALRGDAKIPSATRERVSRAAKALGYTPNPELGRLMFLLRGHQAERPHATLALLSIAESPAPADAFRLQLLQGIRERSATLGFDLDSLTVNPATTGARRLTEILRSRGIKGLLLAPTPAGFDHRGLLDWTQFAAVTTSSAVRAAQETRIVPHYLQIAELALTHLARAGYRRIGWVGTEHENEGAHFLYQAALVMAQQARQIAPLPALASATPAALFAWQQQHRPDALLVSDEPLAARLSAAWSQRPALRRPLVVLNHSGRGPWAGVHQHPLTIGRMAVELLARLLRCGDADLSDRAAITMIEGTWHEAAGATVGAALPQPGEAAPELPPNAALAPGFATPLRVAQA